VGIVVSIAAATALLIATMVLAAHGASTLARLRRHTRGREQIQSSTVPSYPKRAVAPKVLANDRGGCDTHSEEVHMITSTPVLKEDVMSDDLIPKALWTPPRLLKNDSPVGSRRASVIVYL